MEKEQVIEALEEVFAKACENYNKRLYGSVTEIRELGETIITAKRNIAHDIEKAEKFIENKIEKKVNEKCEYLLERHTLAQESTGI